MKKRSERRKHCTLAVVRWSQKFFIPPQTPFPGAHDSQNLISRRWSLPSPTNPVCWRSMHAISSYRGKRPTRHKNTPTNTQDWLQYTALQLARSVTRQTLSRVHIEAERSCLIIVKQTSGKTPSVAEDDSGLSYHNKVLPGMTRNVNCNP